MSASASVVARAAPHSPVRSRAAIDRNDFRECQRRVCMMRLLGELYNYKLLDSSQVLLTA